MTASVVEFYSGASRDHRGRTLEELLGWPDDRLEAVHDFIQWLFPLPEASPVNPYAPLLTRDAVEAFHTRPELRARLRASLERMLKFYGLELRDTAPDSPPEVVPAKNFSARSANWLRPGNHNLLRITRMLKCCTLAGLDTEARAFLQRLEAIHGEHRGGITAESLRYWREAVRVPPD
jgi:hypothetical protein